MKSGSRSTIAWLFLWLHRQNRNLLWTEGPAAERGVKRVVAEARRQASMPGVLSPIERVVRRAKGPGELPSLLPEV
jgi:hypothetical protein